MILVIDTETTGLFESKIEPRLVSIAWEMHLYDGSIYEKENFVIYPNNFEIPAESTKIHGISDSYARECGENLDYVLKLFKSKWNISKVVVGHNLDFDLEVIQSEYRRRGINLITSNKAFICTKEISTEFCKIPSIKGYKWPKLSELYFKLFGENYYNKHNAANDAEVTSKCFWKLYHNNVINLKIEEIVRNRGNEAYPNEQYYLVNGKKNGLYRRFADFNSLEETGFFLDDKKWGLWKKFHEPQDEDVSSNELHLKLASVESYENGHMIESMIYDDQGKLRQHVLLIGEVLGDDSKYLFRMYDEKRALHSIGVGSAYEIEEGYMNEIQYHEEDEYCLFENEGPSFIGTFKELDSIGSGWVRNGLKTSVWLYEYFKGKKLRNVKLINYDLPENKDSKFTGELWDRF